MFVYNATLTDACSSGKGALLVRDGLIRAVYKGDFSRGEAEAFASAAGGGEIVDGGGLTLMPSFIDMHAHFRYPGQPQKETLESALRAATAGGFGLLVLMANTNPPVSCWEDAAAIENAAAEYGLADVFQAVTATTGFDGVRTGHLAALPVLGDCTCGTGYVPVVSEDGRDVASASVMLDAMKICAGRGLIMSCHCEDAALAAAARPHRIRALELLRSSPADADMRADKELMQADRLLALAENIAAERNLSLAQEAGCRIHIAHVSTAAAADAVRRAKRERPEAVTCEVTPLHLALSADPQNRRNLVNPPIRSESDREALIRALCEGVIDCIATDHAPHTEEDKANGAPGFTALETAFAVCHTELVCRNYMDLSRLSALMSANPARILGVDKGALPRGRLLPGYAADFVLADTERKWIADPALFYSKGKATPFRGRELTGMICAAYRRGKRVWQRGFVQPHAALTE